VKTVASFIFSEADGATADCSPPAAKNERRHAPTRFISVI
jgi:hypothetical protein